MNEILPIYFLYTEIHYRLFGWLSFLWKNQPEIVADVPYRTEPGAFLPVFCLIKDAHLFPLNLNRIDVEIIYPDGDCEKYLFPYYQLFLNNKLWKTVFFIKIKEGFSGHIQVNVFFSYSVN